MITVFVNVMTKGSIMEVMNQKTDKNDYSIVFYAIPWYDISWRQNVGHKCNNRMCNFVNLDETQGYWAGMTCPRCSKGVFEKMEEKK